MKSLRGILLFFACTAAAGEWEATVENYLHYTTDVSLFSASRRLAHDQDPTLPLIETEFAHRRSDVVYEPEITLYRRLNTRLGQGRFGIIAEGFIFRERSRFTHPLVGIDWTQAIPGGYRILLRYTAVPDLYLGRNRRRPLADAPHAEGENDPGLAPEEVSTHYWSLGLGHDFGERIHARIFGRYGLRRYEAPFEHRDNDFWTVGVHLEMESTENVEMILGYHFERAYADGRHRPELRDDVSYRNHYLTGEFVIAVTPLLTLEIGGHYERNGWTSAIEGDIRRGEYEDTVQGEVALLYRLTDHLEISLELQGIHRKESFEDTGIASYNTSFGLHFLL